MSTGQGKILSPGNIIQDKWVILEFIGKGAPGDTLRFTMSEEGFYPEEALLKGWLESYYFQILNGVKAIHALHMVHRDLKPENVLMDDQTPKIADFGLARSSSLKPVTQSMDIKGTAHYMSPEHFFDFRKVDHRADIFSLGKILHEAINGKFDQKSLPFKSASLANPDTPFFRKLDQTIRDATAEKKENRLDSVDKLHNALLEAIADLKKETAIEIPVKPKRLSFLHKSQWIWTGVALAVWSVAAMTVWHFISTPEKQLRPRDITPIAVETVQQPKPGENNTAAATKPDGPQPTLLTEDGTTLRLIPGGTVKLPAKTA